MRQLPQSRIRREPTGKRITLQPRDLLTLEVIQRHGPLPAHYLYEFTKHIAHDELGHRKRLKELWNENYNVHRDFYLDRPLPQFQTYFARCQHLIYDLGEAGREALREQGKLNRFATPPGGGFTHALMTACITASIELGVRRAGYHFIAQEEILRQAPASTQTAKFPLAIPSAISTTLSRGGIASTYRSDRPTIPDQVFGIDYGGKALFFAVEADRATEPVERSNLDQNSYLRKILAYRAINQTAMCQKHFAIPSLIVLNVTVSNEHMQNVFDLVRRLTLKSDGSYGLSNFMFQVAPEFATFLRVPPVLSHLFTDPWRRAGKDPFYINGSEPSARVAIRAEARS